MGIQSCAAGDGESAGWGSIYELGAALVEKFRWRKAIALMLGNRSPPVGPFDLLLNDRQFVQQVISAINDFQRFQDDGGIHTNSSIVALVKPIVAGD